MVGAWSDHCCLLKVLSRCGSNDDFNPLSDYSVRFLAIVIASLLGYEIFKFSQEYRIDTVNRLAK